MHPYISNKKMHTSHNRQQIYITHMLGIIHISYRNITSHYILHHTFQYHRHHINPYICITYIHTHIEPLNHVMYIYQKKKNVCTVHIHIESCSTNASSKIRYICTYLSKLALYTKSGSHAMRALPPLCHPLE